MTKLFVKVKNEAITVGAENKLNEKELFLFVYLWTERNYKGETKTTYDMLMDGIKLSNDKDKSRIKKAYKDTIKSLQDKGYINVDDKKKYLLITFNEPTDNFTKIEFDEFKRFKEPLDLYIYACVKRWQNGYAQYSYSVWADLLERTGRRAKDIIKEAVDKGVIYKQEGTYTETSVDGRKQKKQETNTYSVKPFKLNEQEQPVVEEEIEEKPVVKEQKQPKKQTLSTKDFNFETGKWFEKNTYPNVDDLEIYLLQKENAEQGDEQAKKFVDYCNRRLNGMKKRPKVAEILDENMSKAQENIDQMKWIKEEQEKMMKETSDEDESLELFYKPRSKKVDRTDITNILFDDEILA